MNLLRITVLAVVVFAGTHFASAVAPDWQKFAAVHCRECHGPNVQEGGLRLDTFAVEFAPRSTFDVWVKIHDALRNEEMPPRDQPQPSPTERRAIVAWLETELVAADLARRGDAGRAPIRRLNRTEYENTLRDLLDLPQLPLRDLLPEDSRAYGYDKLGDSLELSHVQMGKYLEAADLAMDAATVAQRERPERALVREYPTQRNGFKANLGNGDAVLIRDFQLDESILPVPGSAIDRARAKDSQSQQPQTANEGGLASLAARAEVAKQKRAELKSAQKDLEQFRGAVGIFRGEGGEFHPHFHEFVTAYAGNYRVRMSLWSFTWDHGRLLPAERSHVVQLRAGPKARERYLGYYDVKSLEPTVVETEVWLNPGDQLGFNATTLRPFALTGPGGRTEWVGQGMAIDWMEVDGPLVETWPTTSHRRLFGDVPLVVLPADSPLRKPDHALAAALGQLRGKARGQAKKFAPWAVTSTQPQVDAQRLLTEFLPRAFRRPVVADEVARYAAIVEHMQAENLTFEDALRWAYKTALCSVDFLYFAEPSGPLDDWALASRLSYFLWNSLPDETLAQATAAGKLRDPETLHAQVERMLDDPKAERFVRDFLDQWLDLAEIDATTPDRKLYPEFNSYLRDSMLSESRTYFRELLARDRSVLDVVDSDYAWLNQRLAEHYGLTDVVGTQIRRVSLPADCKRGGMLTQAAILKVTANGTTTTPVKRGAWVMREIVGRPPEPPPPNVPAVEPDINGTTTIRAQLDQHRNNTACASCHAKIDPAGFALENFDVIGGWRTRYRSLGEGEPTKSADGRNVAYLLGPTVDASGRLADGRAFNDIDGFRRLLLSDPDRVARNVVEQLLTYSTGAEVGFADRGAVAEIVTRVRERKYGLRTMIHEIVGSPLFLNK